MFRQILVAHRSHSKQHIGAETAHRVPSCRRARRRAMSRSGVNRRVARGEHANGELQRTCASQICTRRIGTRRVLPRRLLSRRQWHVLYRRCYEQFVSAISTRSYQSNATPRRLSSPHSQSCHCPPRRFHVRTVTAARSSGERHERSEMGGSEH